MKKLFYLTPVFYFVVFLVFFISSCSNNEPDFTSANKQTKKSELTTTVESESKAGYIFKGNHKIYPVKDGKYFYIYHVTNYPTPFCSFLWETNDGYISSSSIKYTNIRFEVDETTNEPYIKFNWDSDNISRPLQDYIYRNVNYMVVVTNNSNFHELFSYSDQNSSQIVTEDD